MDGSSLSAELSQALLLISDLLWFCSFCVCRFWWFSAGGAPLPFSPLLSRSLPSSRLLSPPLTLAPSLSLGLGDRSVDFRLWPRLLMPGGLEVFVHQTGGGVTHGPPNTLSVLQLLSFFYIHTIILTRSAFYFP